MEDIGLHPDSGNPIEREHGYETIEGYGLVCPWCKTNLDPGYDLEELFEMAFNEVTEFDRTCHGCEATLEIRYSFLALAEPYTAKVVIEVEATKRIA